MALRVAMLPRGPSAEVRGKRKGDGLHSIRVSIRIELSYSGPIPDRYSSQRAVCHRNWSPGAAGASAAALKVAAGSPDALF
jgi:hypothetical protein